MFIASTQFSLLPLAALSWQPLPLLPLAALAVLVAAAAVALMYPRQLQGQWRLWRTALPLLRVAALVALAVSLLKPVIVRPLPARNQGTIAVLVDRSLSMSIRDYLADAADRAALVGLADALGKIAPNTRRSASELAVQTQKLLSAADQAANLRSELEFARISGSSPTAAESRLGAAVEAMLIAARQADSLARQLGAPIGADLPRLIADLERQRGGVDLSMVRQRASAIRSRALAAQTSFDAGLYQRNAQVRQVCDDLARLSRFELVERLLMDPGRGLLARLGPTASVRAFGFAENLVPLNLSGGREPGARLGTEPDGTRTEVIAALREAMQRMGQQPLQGIVLLSDGRFTAERVGVSALSLPVPVFAVPAAAPVLRDLAIADVALPRTQFVGETLTVRVDPRMVHIDPREVSGNAELSVGDVEATPQPLRVREGRLEPVEFQVKLQQAGLLDVRITLPQMRSEVSYDNNQAQRWVKVVPQKLKVALLSSAPTWDLRYLRNALSRTEWVQLQDFSLDDPAAPLPLAPRQILEQDLVILNDFSAASLSDAQRTALRQLVQQGGAAILIAGDQHLPGVYQRDPDLSALLPFEAGRPVWRAWPGEDPAYRPQLAPGAELLDALRLDLDPVANRSRWNSLPPMFRYLTLPPLRPAARALLLERESGLPLLTQMRVGSGLACFVAFNESWRWRLGVGERDQDRFWLQLVRSVVEEPYAASDGAVSLDVNRLVASPTEPLRVRVKVSDPLVVAEAGLNLQVFREGLLYQTQELWSMGVPGHLQSTLTGLATGDYELRLMDAEGATRASLPLAIAPNTDAELADPTADMEQLRALAAGSGGEVVPLSDLASLPKRLAETDRRQLQQTQLPLWSSAYLFLFVLGCLTLEWAMRKRLGLP